jgi:hypothetical protein
MDLEPSQKHITIETQGDIKSLLDQIKIPLSELTIKTSTRNMLSARQNIRLNEGNTELHENEKSILVETNASFCTIGLGVGPNGTAGHSHRPITKSTDSDVNSFISDIKNIINYTGDESTLLIMARSFFDSNSLQELDSLLNDIIIKSNLHINLISLDKDQSSPAKRLNPVTGFIYLPKWLSKNKENTVFIVNFGSSLVNDLIDAIALSQDEDDID